MRSPEETGRYMCPKCHNTRVFVGYDDLGYPGPDACRCGKRICTCMVTLTQVFAIGDDGTVHYTAFKGGANGAEISAYTRIRCAECGEYVWTADTPAIYPRRPKTTPAPN